MFLASASTAISIWMSTPGKSLKAQLLQVRPNDRTRIAAMLKKYRARPAANQNKQTARRRKQPQQSMSLPRGMPIKYGSGDSNTISASFVQKSHSTLGPGTALAPFPLSYNLMSMAVLDVSADQSEGVHLVSPGSGNFGQGHVGGYVSSAEFIPSNNLVDSPTTSALQRTVAAYAKIQYTGPALYAQSTFLIAHSPPMGRDKLLADVAIQVDNATQSFTRVSAHELAKGVIIPFRAASVACRNWTGVDHIGYPKFQEDDLTAPWNLILVLGINLAATSVLDITVVRHTEARFPLGSIGSAMSTPPQGTDHPIVHAMADLGRRAVVHAAQAAEPLIHSVINGAARGLSSRVQGAIEARAPQLAIMA